MKSNPSSRDFMGRHGIREAECDAILENLGRHPNDLEVALFSAMWSEHCSYKSSRSALKGLPTEGPAVIHGPGENAGVVRFAENLEIAFKIESHNHPSFVEPYQGAATGVGGILRDVIAMGARPIAVLDALFFGSDGAPRTRHVVKGVVGGVAGYGNCIGIPTVGGMTFFDPAYDQHPLVNVMAIGRVGPDGPRTSACRTVGDRVLVFGCATGRDGAGGARFASREFGDSIHEDRPAVQIADPFTGKRLLEACQELFGMEGVHAIQDMGAAGLTCGTAEMASRGGTGMRLDLDQVPVREAAVDSISMMLSETQERMMAVVRPDAVEKVGALLERWGLRWAEAGIVTREPVVEIIRWGEVQARVPAMLLTDGCPRFAHESNPTAELAPGSGLVDRPALEVPPLVVLQQLLGAPGMGAVDWIHEQYDWMVGTDTILGPGEANAAVMRFKDRDVWLAATTDVNPRLVSIDPRRGTMHAVAEAVANLACVGAEPIAMTDGLNFGNPEDPTVYGQFLSTLDGLSEACRGFGLPIVSGNVSFYNQSSTTRVDPTPIIGLVGRIPAMERPVGRGFKGEDSLVYLVGDGAIAWGGSAVDVVLRNLRVGPIAPLDLSLLEKIACAIRECVRSGDVLSCHDVSQGGLGVGLAESCMLTGRGFNGKIGSPAADPHHALFAEGAGRYLLEVSHSGASGIETRLKAAEIPFKVIGRTTRDPVLALSGLFDAPLRDLVAAWRGGSL